MYLSNRLTFSLVFPILLFAAFTFVVVPAMGSGLVVQYEAELTAAQDDEDGKWEVTFDFQQADGSFTKNDFITGSGEDEMVNVALGASDFSDDDDRVAKDEFSYANKVLTVTIPMTDETADQSPAIAFQVTGYALQTQSADTSTAITMAPAEDSLRGKGYLVFTRSTTALPELPASVDTTTTTGSDVEILAWTGTAQTGLDRGLDADLNLEEFFHVGGGAIHLKIIDMVAPSGGNAAATAMTTKNSRHLVINEVMWAVDDRLVGQDGYLAQQWIEVYNTTSIPVPLDRIVFETDEVHPTQNAGASDLPDGTSDSLSNIPKINTIWSVLGSNGSSTLNDDDTPAINGANPPFVSMYRNNAGKDGWEAGQWTVSGRPYLNGFYGTPGGANARGGLPGVRPATPTITPPKDKIVINEIGKSAPGDPATYHDWIELKNITDTDQSLKGYSLTITTGFGDETQIIDFADADKILANGHLLLLNSHPDTNKHIRGFDIRTDAGAQLFGVNEADSHRYLEVDDKIQIPADDVWLLILRSNADDKFHQSSYHIHDVAGPGGGHADFVVQDRGAADNLRKDKNDKGEDGKGSIWHTRVWPLNGQNAANKDHLLRHNHGAAAIPLGVDNKVWTRNTSKQGYAHGAFSAAGYTGVGYDRKTPPDAVNGGTPGYPNDTLKSTLADIGGKLIVSELMINNDGGRAPQWIELQNTSATHAIMFGDPDGDKALKPWRIEFENHNSGTWKSENRPLNVGFNLSDLFDSVPPGQTLLIVSTKVRGSALSNEDHFPNHRVASIEEDKKADFKLANKRDMFLNGEGGFTITIKDSSGAISDMVGNLDGKAASVRDDIPLDAPYGWDWSTALAEDGSRTSLLRLKNEDGTPRAGTPIRPVAATEDSEAVEANMDRGSVIPLGTPGDMRSMEAAWIHAVDTLGSALNEITYYGDKDDYGTPLYTTGKFPFGALPVELSFFRPTLEDGKVTIQWTTESELDNAGFNILRSDSRDGEFKQVNEQMIQGKGTTAARSTYKWVDTTAKPGAVYYYQIEDVSFAGEHNTLATTKLKGLISAKGKLTTSWGDIKNASQ